LQILNDAPALENAVRTPPNWRMNLPAAYAGQGVGGSEPSFVGAAALLDFRLEVTLDDETLPARSLLQITDIGRDGCYLRLGQVVRYRLHDG
jgi:hypothetical protein